MIKDDEKNVDEDNEANENKEEVIQLKFLIIFNYSTMVIKSSLYYNSK